MLEGTTENPAPLPTPVEGETTESPPPKHEPISKNYAALANKEKAIRRREEAFKAERTAFEAERTRYQASLPQAPKPKSALELLQPGATAEDVAKATRAELDRQRQEYEERERVSAQNSAQLAQQNAEAYLEDFKDSIHTFIKQKEDDYELTALNNGQNLVYDEIVSHYTKTLAHGKPHVLTIKEAADIVEGQFEKHMEKLLAAKKLVSVLDKRANPAQKDPAEASSAAPKRTLNNGMTQTTPTFVHKSSVQDDAFKRALSKLG